MITVCRRPTPSCPTGCERRNSGLFATTSDDGGRLPGAPLQPRLHQRGIHVGPCGRGQTEQVVRERTTTELVAFHRCASLVLEEPRHRQRRRSQNRQRIGALLLGVHGQQITQSGHSDAPRPIDHLSYSTLLRRDTTVAHHRRRHQASDPPIKDTVDGGQETSRVIIHSTMKPDDRTTGTIRQWSTAPRSSSKAMSMPAT